MKNIIKNKFIKKIFFILLIIYISMVFINQQKTLASYTTQKKYYEDKICVEKENNKALLEQKSNINSDSYIEKMAREKLDMCTESERVYVDINK